MIRRARKRIFLSSLYIGSGETYLVSAIVLTEKKPRTTPFRQINALEYALKRNPGLQVHLHLDYNRSTRPGPESTTAMLIPLLRKYQDRVHTYLFKSPKLKGLMKKLVPRRFDEGWGTWHAKVYGADDEILISG